MINSSINYGASSLSQFLTHKTRQLLQAGALSTSIGSLCVSVLLIIAFYLNGEINYLSWFCFLSLIGLNTYRIILSKNLKMNDSDWLRIISLTTLGTTFFYCILLAQKFMDSKVWQVTLFGYIVINALVSASVFWQFLQKRDVLLSITLYLSTAAFGVFYWSHTPAFTFLVVSIIVVYFGFLVKQTHIKRQAWLEQKTEEFNLRSMISQLPGSVFGLEQKGKDILSHGSVNELHVIVIDELKRLVSLSNQAEREQARIDKMASIGEMVSSIMHEINNPIAIIASRAQVMERILNQNSASAIQDLNRHVEVVLRNAFRASKIITGTKALVRETNEKNFQWSTLGEIQGIVDDLVRDKCEKNQVRLQFNFLDCTEGTKIFCFPLQIGQVLINLGSNSIDAIKELDQEKRWVSFNFSLSAGGIQIRVQDGGSGLAEEIARKIEDPFFTSKQKGEGNGLGLHISRRIVESHKGRIYYNPKSKNTEFIVELPSLNQAA